MGTAVNFHGTFTHAIVFPLFFLVVGSIFHYKKNIKWSKIFYVIAAGWFLHLILDCLFGGYKSFLWPFFSVGGFCPQWFIGNYMVEIDAIILVLWLVHEEIHNKIKDYI